MLLKHAQLNQQDDSLRNLELLGARVYKALKDTKPTPVPIFPPKQPPAVNDESMALSRFEPNLKTLLDEHIRGTLDPVLFPYTKPDIAPTVNDTANISSASLRSAKPTWARAKLSSVEPRQRVIVFMAGGATYSEARSCYEVTAQTSRDVVLMTSHMTTPKQWIGQLHSLSQDRRSLHLPADRPPKKAPAHLYAPKASAPMPAGVRQSGGLPSAPNSRMAAAGPAASAPPVDRMGAMSLGGNRRSAINPNGSETSDPHKLKKEKYDTAEKEKKKKHGFFGSKR
jgi:syntaxin-binding protein 1